jgi:hypothetical protein
VSTEEIEKIRRPVLEGAACDISNESIISKIITVLLVEVVEDPCLRGVRERD